MTGHSHAPAGSLGRLAGSTLAYGLGEASNRLLAFLLLPLFTAHLTPEDYGIASILGVVSFLAVSVLTLGLGSSLAISYFEGGGPQERREAAVGTALAILAACAVVVALLGAVFARQIGWMVFQRGGHEDLVAISLATAGLSMVAIPLRLHLQFEHRAAEFLSATLLGALAAAGISLVFVVWLGRGVHGLVEAGFLGQVVGLLLVAIAALRRFRLRASRAIARELLGAGLPLVPPFAFLFVIQNASKYALQVFHGSDAVGVYSVGVGLGQIATIFVAAFQGAWTPFFMPYSARPDEARALFGRIFTYYALVAAVLGIGCYALARPVVLLMTQPPFHDAYTVVGLSATAQLLTGAYAVLLPPLYFAKRVGHVALVQAVAAAMTVGLCVALVPPLGVFGAGLALALGVLAMVAVQHAWNVAHRAWLRVQYEWGRVGVLAAAYAAVAVLAVQERHLGLPAEFGLACAFALPALATGALLRRDERDGLWALGRSLARRLAGGSPGA